MERELFLFLVFSDVFFFSVYIVHELGSSLFVLSDAYSKSIFVSNRLQVKHKHVVNCSVFT